MRSTVERTASGNYFRQRKGTGMYHLGLPAGTWDDFHQLASTLPGFAGVWIDQAANAIRVGVVENSEAGTVAFELLRQLFPTEIDVIRADLRYPYHVLAALMMNSPSG